MGTFDQTGKKNGKLPANQSNPTTSESESPTEAVVKALAISADLRVGQVAHAPVLECTPDVPIYQAARRMQEARCSSIIVVDENGPMGIWTERDALAMDFAHPENFNLPIGQVMSAPVKTVHEDVGLQEVGVRFREEGLRHFLVVDDEGQPKGIISQTDLVLNHGIEHYLRLRKVKAVVKRPFVNLREGEALGNAARMMREGRTDALVVEYTDGSHGILTERDIVRLIAGRSDGERVGDVASRPLLTVPADSTLYRVRRMLLESKLRHIGVTGEDGSLVGLISFADIISGMEFAYVEELQNALRERDRALSISRRSLHLAEKIIESSPEGVVITDKRGAIMSVNPAFTRVTGYSAEEAVGNTPNLLSSGRHDEQFYRNMWSRLAQEGHWQGEIWNRRKNGEIYPELLTITAISDEDGELSHYAALFSDISELKENEERIRNLAYYDALTGLPNRRLFNDRLSVAVAHAHRNGNMLAVMFIDLDRFKRVNDSLGHSVGDALLQEVTERLGECVREDDTVARMGGDEFICILSDVQGPDDAAMVARRIQEGLSRPMQIEGEELTITSSIGISIYPEDGTTPETLVRNADAAMYRAKDTGRDSYQLYTPAMNARTLEHLAMETAMRKALERDEFLVHYQPIVDATGRLSGAEALLRWHHPEMGIILPSDFIPLAEETGLINPIGEVVLRSVCRTIRGWREAGLTGTNVAVNISARQFAQDDFLEQVSTILEEEKVPASSLTFELTESLLMDDAVRTIRMLQAIRAMGIDISVDDFGVGYSSLNYLKRFPINKLKVDRAFIRGIAEADEDAAIVSAVISLSHSLRMQVVAEGVEEDAQVQFLRESGCELLQGFFYGRPMPQEEFARSYLKPDKADGSHGSESA
jgi:diguanylate cyclase (GGDEF)-like protein/PAS domain S-box-containing protein